MSKMNTPTSQKLDTVHHTAKEFVLGMKKQMKKDYALEENYVEEGIYGSRIAD